MTLYGDHESKFEHKMIPNLNYLRLPEKDTYKEKIGPYHAVIAANYRDVNYPQFVRNGVKAKGLVKYFPADLKVENGRKVVYDLLFDERDMEISFLFETQPNLTELKVGTIDQALMIDHCPEKAKGQYFLMPETLAVYEEKLEDDNYRIYYRLLPSLPMLPEERSLRHTVEYKNYLEMSVRLFYEDYPDLKFSLTPDVLEYIESQKQKSVDAGIPLVINEKLDQLLRGQEAIRTNILNAIPAGEEPEYIKNIYELLTAKNEALDELLKSNEKIYSLVKKVKKKTGNVEDTLELVFGKLISDKVVLDIELNKGVEKGDAYIVQKARTFELEGTIQSFADKFKLKKVKTNFEIASAWYNGSEKEIIDDDYAVEIKEELGIKDKGALKLIIYSPEDEMYFNAELVGKVRVENEDYKVMLPSEKILIKPGNVKAQKALKITKKVLKFAAPKIAKRIKAAIE